MALTLIQTEDEKYDRLKTQKVIIHFITTRSHKTHFYLVQSQRPFQGDLWPSQWFRGKIADVLQKTKTFRLYFLIKTSHLTRHTHT